MASRLLLLCTNRSMSLEYWYLMEIVGLVHGRTLSRRWMSTSRFLAALTWVLSKQFTKMCRSGIFITTLVISLFRLMNSFRVRSIIKIFFTGNKMNEEKGGSVLFRLQKCFVYFYAYDSGLSVKNVFKTTCHCLSYIWLHQYYTLHDICNENENAQSSTQQNSS